MGRCSCEAWRRLPWVAFISLRLVYVLFFAVACFAFHRVSSLLEVEVCGLHNSTVNGPACTDMWPVILSCLVSSVLSFLVIILHTAIELALRARGPMRYLCGETAEYGQGFLAMLRVCIVFVLLQTTVSFLGVAMFVRRVIEPNGELGLDDNCSVVVAAGVLAALACTLTVLDAAVRALSTRCQSSRFGEAMGAPLSPATPLGTPRSAPRWRVRGMSPRPQTVSASTSDWRVGGPCAYTGE